MTHVVSSSTSKLGKWVFGPVEGNSCTSMWLIWTRDCEPRCRMSHWTSPRDFPKIQNKVINLVHFTLTPGPNLPIYRPIDQSFERSILAAEIWTSMILHILWPHVYRLQRLSDDLWTVGARHMPAIGNLAARDCPSAPDCQPAPRPPSAIFPDCQPAP